MKKLFLLTCVLLSLHGFSTTYYVSTMGNDANAGTLASPWLTLHHACATVTTPGDVIHVNAGTYLENGQMSLSPGVSIEGDGVTSVIQDTVTAQFVPILSLSSAEGTNGNQHISNLKFDGRSLATSWAIAIGGRSNVSIYNCSFVDFMETGVNWSGRNDGNQTAPSTYATGNSFHDNIMNNCATFEGTYGRGCFQFGGQDGMQIYNNSITNNSRSDGANGWPIKGCNDSYIKNCRIHHNTLTSAAFPFDYAGENNYWDFAVELFDNLGGNEIDHNTITGSIDFNRQSRSSGYSLYIHDNTIGFSTMQAHHQYGIILEFSSDSVIVDNNIIRNVAKGVFFSLRDGDTVQRTVISRNLIYHVGTAQGGNFGVGIDIVTGSPDTYRFLNNSYFNNTIVADPTYPPYWGIGLSVLDPSTASSQINNIKVENNIVQGFIAAAVVSNFLGSITNSNFTYNNFYDNGNSDAPFPSWASSTTLGGSNTVASNTTADPLFVGGGDYTLQSGSTMIDAGVNVGFSFNGTAPDKGYAEYIGFTTYYVSTTGNNANDGSAAHPWLTLYHACATATTPGDLIHVNAGTFVETAQCLLSAGVSIEGDGVTSIIKDTITASGVAILKLSSPQGTDGNQHVSGLKFDGQSLASFQAVSVSGRSNVSINNCTFLDFREIGVNWSGRNDDSALAPSIYARGNSFHDNIMNNCALADMSYGRGAFQFGGQDSMMIYNNTITDTSRSAGTNGFPIRGCNDSYIKNCRIHDNTLRSAPFPYNYSGENNYFDFAIQLFNNLGGNQIDHNTISGSVFVKHQSRSTGYSLYIHDNTIGFPTMQSHHQYGIFLVSNSDSVIVDNNVIRNVAVGIVFSVLGDTIQRTVISRNLIYHVGTAQGGNFGSGIEINSNGVDTYKFLNNSYYNNTIVADPTNTPYWGISFSVDDPSTASSQINNFNVKNNIVAGFNVGGSGIVSNFLGSITNSSFAYNNFYDCDAAFPSWTSATTLDGTNTVASNTTSDPLFVGGGDYTLQDISTMIDAGIDVGLPFLDSAPDIGYAEYGASSRAFRSGGGDTPEPGILINSNSGDLVVKAMPNPFTNYFNLFVKTNDSKAITLVIFDIMGRKLEAVNDVQHNKWVHMGEKLANGIYFIQISQGLQKRMIKVLKQ